MNCDASGRVSPEKLLLPHLQRVAQPHAAIVTRPASAMMNMRLPRFAFIDSGRRALLPQHTFSTCSSFSGGLVFIISP